MIWLRWIFFDFQKPFIFGIDDVEINFSAGPSELQKIVEIASKNAEDFDYIKRVKKIVGRFIGVNIEPVPEGVEYVEGRKLNKENLLKAKEYGFDYIVITGNPNTGVSVGTIIKGIELAKEILGENMMIIAGKMHGAGSGNIYEDKILKDFVKAGADCVLIPAPGTVPGIDLNLAKRQIDAIHQVGALAMTTIGTSQEGSQKKHNRIYRGSIKNGRGRHTAYRRCRICRSSTSWKHNGTVYCHKRSKAYL